MLMDFFLSYASFNNIKESVLINMITNTRDCTVFKRGVK